MGLGRGDIVAVACILLLFVLFALGVVALQCCFNECHRRRARAQQAASSSSSQSARWLAGGNNGGDPEALVRPLPTATVYRAASREEGGAAAVECVVCLADLEDGEAARFLPCCNHGFHARCVDTWLASRSTCPLCRVNVAPPPPASSSFPRLPAGRVVSDQQGEVSVATRSIYRDRRRLSHSTTAAVMAVEIPVSLASAVPAATPSPCDVVTSTGLTASIWRLWTAFAGRQRAGPMSSS